MSIGSAYVWGCTIAWGHGSPGEAVDELAWSRSKVWMNKHGMAWHTKTHILWRTYDNIVIIYWYSEVCCTCSVRLELPRNGCRKC
ncbi:hypothetical protein BDU57DRAFT_522095 [Ampelomyces quisqualis]|uniref:Uncharacterized protein n=1 Tax=Ampelomyces quisqualis TaxID=50730 RepID=A0A6A5QCJ4_AMPQU|nr:hypothetical protein BDU57DRAFT_522095 [Ampelomyces quisqualis]